MGTVRARGGGARRVNSGPVAPVVWFGTGHLGQAWAVVAYQALIRSTQASAQRGLAPKWRCA